MTKIDRFNQCGLTVDRIRSHEGPTLRLTALYRGCSRIFTDPEQLLKWIGWPENYEQRVILKDWLDNPPWVVSVTH